jgi:uncharacterized membrane protein YgcG
VVVFLAAVGITLVGAAALVLLGVLDRVTDGLVGAFPPSWQFGAWFALTAGGCYAAYIAYQRIRNGAAGAADAATPGLWVAAGGGEGSDESSGDDYFDAGTAGTGNWEAGDDRDRGLSNSPDTGGSSGSSDGGSSDSGGGSSSSSND